MKHCCRIYPHPLKDNTFVLIVEHSPLHYIGTEQECIIMQKRWERKIEEYGKHSTPRLKAPQRMRNQARRRSRP